jgi:adenylate cyclase
MVAAMASEISRLRHDLRTPLNQMLGYSEMLLEENPEQPVVAHELQQILNDAKRLLSLMTKVLEVEGVSRQFIRSELEGPVQKIFARVNNLLAEAGKNGWSNLQPDLEKIVEAATNLDALLTRTETEPGAGAVTAASASNQAPLSAAAPEWVEPGQVLVVDDSEMNRDMLSRRLERQGHRVGCAENGRKALEMLAEKEFDLVLLDIIMPEMDGYQTLAAIKNNPKLRHLPVIMLSALDEIESVVRGIEMGAEDYLPKPFNPVILKARIDACLEKKRHRDQEQAFLRELQSEREKSERLLLNVLPEAIAKRLKQGETSIADQFSEVTILFADLVGFTSLARHISPVEVLNLLNEIFSAFDELAARHGLEKIKTIGDAYMVAGGLPVRRADHVEAIAEMALDIQKEINRFNADYSTQVQIRIGINTGPVVAGIIGRKKFIYDLWGETVNTASRMESHGIAGGIQVTAETQARLDGKYIFQDRGKIAVKGEGDVQCYLLLGRKVFPA